MLSQDPGGHLSGCERRTGDNDSYYNTDREPFPAEKRERLTGQRSGRKAGRRGQASLLPIALAVVTFLSLTSPVRALRDIESGQTPPPFTLTDGSGRKLSLEHFSDSPGAIIFWSTWSPRSVEILEDFRLYHEEYASRGLKVVAINVDGENLNTQRKADIRRYVEEMNLPFPVLLDENLEAFVAYGVMAHPSAVLLGRDGRVAYTLGGYPLTLREEMRENLLKVLGIAVEPEVPEVPSVGYVPGGGALQYYNLGKRLVAKSQPERARAAFRTALERDPSFLDPAVMIARLALLDGDVEEAEKVIRSADPDTVNRDDLRFLLGHMMLVKGKEEAAEKAFRRLQERSPSEGWGLWGLGLVALTRDDIAGALERMEEAAALRPAPIEAEALVRKHLVGIWLRGESDPREEGFLTLFPSLSDLRDRYRKLFDRAG